LIALETALRRSLHAFALKAQAHSTGSSVSVMIERADQREDHRVGHRREELARRAREHVDRQEPAMITATA
jgi:hypothetical protein